RRRRLALVLPQTEDRPDRRQEDLGRPGRFVPHADADGWRRSARSGRGDLWDRRRMGSRERRRQPGHRSRIRSGAMAARPRPATGKSRGAPAGRTEAQSIATEQTSGFPELWETGGSRFGQLTRVALENNDKGQAMKKVLFMLALL